MDGVLFVWRDGDGVDRDDSWYKVVGEIDRFFLWFTSLLGK